MFGKRRHCYLPIIVYNNNKCNYNMRKCVTATIYMKEITVYTKRLTSHKNTSAAE